MEPDQHVEVHIPNTAPIGGDTQFESFVIEAVTDDAIRGTDQSWGDEIRVEHADDGDGLHLTSGGMSGPVVRIEVMRTTEHGVPIHASGTVVYEDD